MRWLRQKSPCLTPEGFNWPPADFFPSPNSLGALASLHQPSPNPSNPPSNEIKAPASPIESVSTVSTMRSPVPMTRRKSFTERNFSALTAGGVRQSMITLVQTSLGGGILTLAYAMRLSGLGLGSLLLALTGMVAFLGMDVMMRGAIKMEAFDTATLLAKCVGPWSGPAMDGLLLVYGNGSMIAYFILLGDFLPATALDLGLVSTSNSVSMHTLRTWCILATLIVVIPLCIPKKLSALRYATPVALLAVTFTAATLIAKTPRHLIQHMAEPNFRLDWFVFDWNFFKTFSIFLFAYNCHLNVVPVASEMQDPSDIRIAKVNRRVVLVELVFYALIGWAGHLSFLDQTNPNILTNYRNSWEIVFCRVMLSCSLLVGIPTNLNPIVRSAQGFIKACMSSSVDQAPIKIPLLDCEQPTPSSITWQFSHKSDSLRYFLIAACLALEVSVAIVVPNVADVMGFIGASVGTVLMMVLPTVVLLKSLRETLSFARVVFTAVCLIGATVVAFAAIIVMLLQQLGYLPS